MFTKRHDAIRAAAAIGLALGAFDVSSAAPPGKGEPPSAADVAYMSVSYKDTWGNPTKASVRGVAITSAGAAGGDAELWRSATRTSSSIAWDPAGAWLAWFQESASRGTPAIAIATPGHAPVTTYVFSEYLWTSKNSDAVAWGRGCDGNPVLYFLGNYGPTLVAPTLWVMDPFTTGSQPQQVYPNGLASSGLAVSPLGRSVVLSEYYDAFGERGFGVLPLTCVAGSTLPVAAGPAQPLFAIRYDGDPGWTTSLDWSSDGRRLAVAMGRKVNDLNYDPEVWVADLNYLVENGSEQVTFGSLQHSASGLASFPSWAPTTETAACDRLAFSRGGSLMLLDVPRPGFSAVDCDIPSPVSLGGKSVAALDWK